MTVPDSVSRRDFGRKAAMAAAALPFLGAAGATGAAGQSAEAPALRSELLMDIELDIGAAQVAGRRRIVPVTGGTFAGPRLRGRALEGGGDWIRQREDGASLLDVRVTLETDDDAIIYATYQGILYSPPDGELYWRVTPRFETGAEQYDWLNRVVSVGVGRRQPGQAAYWFYHVL